MSLQDFRVKTNKSIPAEEVSDLSCTYDSQTLAGMNDLAVISPLDLTVNDTNSPGNELELDFDVQTEIYRGIENVSEIWIGGGMKFGNSFLWVAQVPVFLLDDYDRTVHLHHNVSYISEYGYDGEWVKYYVVQRFGESGTMPWCMIKTLGSEVLEAKILTHVYHTCVMRTK